MPYITITKPSGKKIEFSSEKDYKKYLYRGYIVSPGWRRKRAKFGKDKSCYICGAKTRLQLHHRTYKRLFRERKGDLVWLCGSCHKKLHEELKKEHNEFSLRTIHKTLRGFNAWKEFRKTAREL